MFKAALCQISVVDDLAANLKTASLAVKDAAEKGADIVCLPEMFCCPYENDKFIKYGQPAGGEIWQALSAMARENSVWLIGGSMPELEGERIYNTAFVFSPEGEQVARHRKVHLFDVDIPGGQYFKESDTLSAGDEFTVFDTPFGRIGVAICFDVRFAEQFRLMTLDGAQAVFVPGAFNMTTGPAHWELLFRSRALDNQLWMLGCAPARCEGAGYVSYGNSIVSSPWGEVMGRLDEKEGTLLADVNTELNAKVRLRIPILSNRRTDLYEVTKK